MQLSPSEIALLRASYARVSEDAETASIAFYDKLFKLAPEVRPYFRDDIADQGMRFFSAMKVILDRLEDPKSLHESLQRLAAGHAALGIHAEHFEPMGKALIATMQDSLGPDLTPETEAAWEKAYNQIAEAMISAGHIRKTSR